MKISLNKDGSAGGSAKRAENVPVFNPEAGKSLLASAYESSKNMESVMNNKLALQGDVAPTSRGASVQAMFREKQERATRAAPTSAFMNLADTNQAQAPIKLMTTDSFL